MSLHDRLRQSGPYILGGSIVVLDQLIKIAELIPNPFVKLGLDAVLSILNVVQTVKENQDACQALMTQLGKLLLVVFKPLVNIAENDIPKMLRDNLEELKRRLQQILSKLEKFRDTPKWKAVLRVSDRTAKLAECQHLMNDAMTFFQVDSLIDGALKLDVVDRKIDAIGMDVKAVLEVVADTAELKYPSCALPSAPDVLFGRELYVENVVERLCYLPDGGQINQPTSNPPRLTILGPGGIGKTSVALTAVADPRVKATYGDRVHWVPSEEATTPELFVELIARSMDVPRSKGGDRKRDILDFLRSSAQPRLLLLDNFETPWDIPTKQTDINNILFDISSISPLSILLTMRSDVPPATRVRWTKPTLPPLTSLSPTAAREMYLDIHEGAGEDPRLDELLHEVAHMPLAVRLMATRGSLGEMPSKLLALWEDERIRTNLLHQGDDRITSVTVSVELSINSNLMHRNPEALTLLSILAELPGGARQDFIQTIAPSIIDSSGALGILQRSALVQMNPSTQHAHLLSPIRSLVLQKHPATTELRSAIHRAYFDLIHDHNFEPGDDGFLKAVSLLAPEAANIESLLLKAMDTEPACIDAAYAYTSFQSFTFPRAEIIEKAVSAVQSGSQGSKQLSRGLGLMVIIYQSLARYKDAVNAGQKALSIFQQSGDQLGEAICLKNLGNCYRMMGRHEDAVDAAEKAMSIFRRIGDQLGEAHCLQSLGNSYRMLGRYEDAVDVAQKAMLLFRQSGDQLGEANCLESTGDFYRMLDRYEDAVDAERKALSIFRRIGNQLGEANSLTVLGDCYRMTDKYEDAVDAGQKALPIYRLIGDKLGEANCLLDLGNCYRMTDKYEDAVDAGQKALSIFQQIENAVGEANCLQSLGQCYPMLGKYEDAVDVEQKALSIFQRSGNQLGEANCLLILGNFYRVLGRYEDALDAGQKAMPIFQRIGSQSGEAYCLQSLDQYYRMMGKYEDAVDAGQKAISIFRRIGSQLGEANSLRSLARAYAQLGSSKDSALVGKEAMEIYLRIGREGDVQECRELLGELGVETS